MCMWLMSNTVMCWNTRTVNAVQLKCESQPINMNYNKLPLHVCRVLPTCVIKHALLAQGAAALPAGVAYIRRWRKQWTWAMTSSGPPHTHTLPPCEDEHASLYRTACWTHMCWQVNNRGLLTSEHASLLTACQCVCPQWAAVNWTCSSCIFRHRHYI